MTQLLNTLHCAHRKCHRDSVTVSLTPFPALCPLPAFFDHRNRLDCTVFCYSAICLSLMQKCVLPAVYRVIQTADTYEHLSQALRWALHVIWATSQPHLTDEKAKARGLSSHNLRALESSRTQALWPQSSFFLRVRFVSPHSWQPWLYFSLNSLQFDM